jgi:fido (protein-threonine AMPylation protein)
VPDNFGYFTEDHDYCYPGTNTLINKLDITNQYELEEIEQKLVSLRLTELNKSTITFPFSTKYLTEIHRYLFPDYLQAMMESPSDNSKLKKLILTNLVSLDS